MFNSFIDNRIKNQPYLYCEHFHVLPLPGYFTGGSYLLILCIIKVILISQLYIVTLILFQLFSDFAELIVVRSYLREGSTSLANYNSLFTIFFFFVTKKEVETFRLFCIQFDISLMHLTLCVVCVGIGGFPFFEYPCARC